MKKSEIWEELFNQLALCKFGKDVEEVDRFGLYVLEQELISFLRKSTFINRKEDLPCDKIANLVFQETYKKIIILANENDDKGVSDFINFLLKKYPKFLERSDYKNWSDYTTQLTFEKNTNARSVVDKIIKTPFSALNQDELKNIFFLIKKMNYCWSLTETVNFAIKLFTKTSSNLNFQKFITNVENRLTDIENYFETYVFAEEENLMIKKIQLDESQNVNEKAKGPRTITYKIAQFKHFLYPQYKIILYTNCLQIDIEDSLEDYEDFRFLIKLGQSVMSNFLPGFRLKIISKFIKLFINDQNVKISSPCSLPNIFNMIKNKHKCRLVINFETKHATDENSH